MASGCNSVYHQLMAHARQAESEGNFTAAVRSYREACRNTPHRDEEACRLAPLMVQKATEKAIAATRQACESGDLDVCLPPLLAVWKLDPKSLKVNTALAQASQLHRERCASQWSAEGPLSTAVAGVVCLQRARQFPVPAYQAYLKEREGQLAMRFSELATAADEQASPGAATVLWSTAQCLSPGGKGAMREPVARNGFLSQSSIPLIIPPLQGSIPPGMAEHLVGPCERMASQLPSAVRCAVVGTTPGQQEPLVVRVDALIEPVEEKFTEEAKSLRYVAGKVDVPNRDYPAARERLMAATIALEEVQRKKKQKNAECEATQVRYASSCTGCSTAKTACEEAQSLKAEYEARSKEHAAATTHLEKTPENVEMTLYDDFQYALKTYRWTSDFHFTLLSSSDTTPSNNLQQGVLSFTDTEHPGLSKAGLEADPLKAPNDADFAKAFLERLTPYVVSAVKRDSAMRGSAREAWCKEQPEDWNIPWLQCWAESTLWKNAKEPQPTEFLQLLVNRADASLKPRCR
jgi:hypothetical protein